MGSWQQHQQAYGNLATTTTSIWDPGNNINKHMGSWQPYQQQQAHGILARTTIRSWDPGNNNNEHMGPRLCSCWPTQRAMGGGASTADAAPPLPPGPENVVRFVRQGYFRAPPAATGRHMYVPHRRAPATAAAHTSDAENMDIVSAPYGAGNPVLGLGSLRGRLFCNCGGVSNLVALRSGDVAPPGDYPVPSSSDP